MRSDQQPHQLLLRNFYRDYRNTVCPECFSSPNPVVRDEDAMLLFNCNGSNTVAVSVVNVLGQEVYHHESRGQGGTVTEKLPGPQPAAAGMYLVNVNFGQGNVETLKLVK
ncbi:MAG: T9SS type A sorting domain-containing protein [Chitinophagaceae bacterium]